MSSLLSLRVYRNILYLLLSIQIISCDASAPNQPISEAALPQSNGTPEASLTDSSESNFDEELNYQLLENCAAPDPSLLGVWAIASTQADVDNDGLQDAVELLSMYDTDYVQVSAIVKVTFGNGAVVANYAGNINLLPEGNTITAIDLHHEPDGMKELIYSSHYGRGDYVSQHVMVYKNCKFEPADSEKTDIGNSIGLHEASFDGEGNTTPGNHSWGCSTADDGTMNVHTQNVIEATAKIWTINTWHLVESVWRLVSSESGEGEIAPEPLQKCL